jgi:hypothetical protein
MTEQTKMEKVIWLVNRINALREQLAEAEGLLVELVEPQEKPPNQECQDRQAYDINGNPCYEMTEEMRTALQLYEGDGVTLTLTPNGPESSTTVTINEAHDFERMGKMVIDAHRLPRKRRGEMEALIQAALLGKPERTATVQDLLPLGSKGAVSGALCRLVRRGKVRKLARGTYQWRTGIRVNAKPLRENGQPERLSRKDLKCTILKRMAEHPTNFVTVQDFRTLDGPQRVAQILVDLERQGKVLRISRGKYALPTKVDLAAQLLDHMREAPGQTYGVHSFGDYAGVKDVREALYELETRQAIEMVCTGGYMVKDGSVGDPDREGNR